MSACCFPSAAAVLSFYAALLKAYFVCFDLSISARELFRVIGEGRNAAGWIWTASNSWSVMTNAQGCAEPKAREIDRLISGNSWPLFWHSFPYFCLWAANDADRIYVMRDVDGVCARQTSNITSIDSKLRLCSRPHHWEWKDICTVHIFLIWH